MNSFLAGFAAGLEDSLKKEYGPLPEHQRRMRFGRERLGSAGIQVQSCAGLKAVIAVEGGRSHYVLGKAGECTMTPIQRS